MKKLFMVIVILIFALIGCSQIKKEQKIEVFSESTPFPKSTIWLYQQELDAGTIYLYKDKSGFRHTFYSKKLKEYFHSGNAVLNSKTNGMVWTMINIPDIPIATFAGIISNDEIDEVVVKQKTEEKRAKIIQTDAGDRVWFVRFEYLEDAVSGQPDLLKIQGISSTGKVLWSDGVE